MSAEINDSFGLEIKIDSHEDAKMSDGEDAIIVYLIIDNRTAKSRRINLSKATYVTKDREQFEQDIWLSGYITGEDTLKPNSYRKAGLVFYKSRIKSVLNNDLIYISIELPLEGIELTLCFQKKENNWILVNKEKTDIEIKLTPKQLEKNLLKRVERLEAFEERLGVSIQNLSLKINTGYIWGTLYCELHSINGTSIDSSIDVECILYDKDGSIIDKKSAHIYSDDFFGFELIEIQFTGDNKADQISKIRIYPKKQ